MVYDLNLNRKCCFRKKAGNSFISSLKIRRIKEIRYHEVRNLKVKWKTHFKVEQKHKDNGIMMRKMRDGRRKDRGFNVRMEERLRA